MSLISEEAEVQKYVPIASDTSIKALNPEIDEVEENVIIKHIGNAFYVEIEAAYQGNPTATQVIVIKRLQEVISNLAVAQLLDTIQIDISNTGLTRHESGNAKTAYKYQKEEAKAQMLRKGWLALENLLAFLESTKATYPTWANSPEYTVNKKLIINSAEVFDEYYAIDNSRLLYQAMSYILKQVEDMELESVIGAALLDEIKAEILAANVSSENQTLLDKYIYAAVANLSVVRALGDMVVKLDVSGAIMHEKLAVEGSSDQEKAAELDRVSAKKFNVQNTGYQYLDKLKDYLNANASLTKYAVFFASDLYEAPVVATDEEYDSNVYLG